MSPSEILCMIVNLKGPGTFCLGCNQETVSIFSYLPVPIYIVNLRKSPELVIPSIDR